MDLNDRPTKPPKHVIILGAGAFKSAGYPLGSELRQLMSSEKAFKEAVCKQLAEVEGLDETAYFKYVFDAQQRCDQSDYLPDSALTPGTTA